MIDRMRPQRVAGKGARAQERARVAAAAKTLHEVRWQRAVAALSGLRVSQTFRHIRPQQAGT